MDDQSRAVEFVPGKAFARVLTETTQALVCVLDAAGRILLFNDACERATGFTRDEVLGREVWEVVIPAEEAEAFREVLAYIWKSGHSSPQVGHWQTKDGARRLIAWSNKPVAGDDGAPAYLVTSGIDLTDRARRDKEDERALEGDPEAKLAEIGQLAQEQRSLRRVATLVASEASPERVFTAVSEECARVLQVNASAVLRYERDNTATVVGRHNRDGIDFVPARQPSAGGRDHDGRPGARDGRAGARGRLGSGHRRVRGDDAPDRLPLHRRGADRRRGRALGRRLDRQRGAVAAGERGAARGVLRAGVAGRRQRPGPGRPACLARPSRQGG